MVKNYRMYCITLPDGQVWMSYARSKHEARHKTHILFEHKWSNINDYKMKGEL